MMLKRKMIYIRTSLYVIFILISLSGCYGLKATLTTPKINELHIVPDGYEGWLVIHYECEGGKPLSVSDKGGLVTIEYDENGYYCTSDQLVASYGQIFAIDTSHNSIPVYSLPSGKHEYAMCCGSSRNKSEGIGNNAKNWVLGLFWIGYMDEEVRDQSMLEQLLIDIQN